MAPKYLAVFAMLNLALFAFMPATNAATCPSLSGCLGIAGLNVQFGSQSSSQCCSLLGGLVNIEAAACLCTSLKDTTSTVAPLTGILGPLAPLLGGGLGPLAPLLGGGLGPLAPLLGGGLGPLAPILGGGLGTLTSQQFSAVFNACGINIPTTFTCA